MIQTTEKACRMAFTETLLAEAKNNKDIVALASDSSGSVSLNEYKAYLPEQYVEIGIAEQDMVGIAAGLATCGKIPFACGPASFLSARSLEQVKVDVAYSQTNVKLIGVSGGISYGALGESHYSLQDIAAMRAIANLTVLLPSDAVQAAALTKTLVSYEGPVYVRMGRGAVPVIYGENERFEIGKAKQLLDGTDITLIATGEAVYHALKVGKRLHKAGVSARVIDMFTVKPLDERTIRAACIETKAILTIEEHSRNGGLGAAVAQVAAESTPVLVKTMAFPDETIVAGTPAEIRKHYGLDEEGIFCMAERILRKVKQEA